MNAQWPCIFKAQLTRSADDQIQREWKERFGEGAPFGSLRKSWREMHCQTLNPYGSSECPYAAEQCVLSFLVVAQRSLTADDPRAYFRKVALSYAITRADNKPPARDRAAQAAAALSDLQRRTGVGDPERRSSDLGSEQQQPVFPGLAPRPVDDLHRRLARPTSIGAMLGLSDRGSRPAPERVEGEGQERPVSDDGDVLVPQRG